MTGARDKEAQIDTKAETNKEDKIGQRQRHRKRMAKEKERTRRTNKERQIKEIFRSSQRERRDINMRTKQR